MHQPLLILTLLQRHGLVVTQTANELSLLHVGPGEEMLLVPSEEDLLAKLRSTAEDPLDAK